MGPILKESNLMQMYGSFEGFPLNNALFWVGNIMTPVWLKNTQNFSM